MAEPLKNMFNAEVVEKLTQRLLEADSKFNSKAFLKAVLNKNWESLELKERVAHITEQINVHLPYSYEEQLKVLDETVKHFGGLIGIIFPTFVEKYGLEFPDLSFEAMERYTPFSTSEFAVRPFLVADHNRISHFYEWAKSDNHHVRRLASEGCRPLLPWAIKLHHLVDDPSPIIPILEELKNDPEDYVYRSVANNLNDISKNHPDLVLDLAEKWYGPHKNTNWVVKHALRTLLKKGNQRAMIIFGFGKIDQLNVEEFALKSDKSEIGGKNELQLKLVNKGPKAKFRLEYSIDYLKKNGSHSEKVFQIKETELKKGEIVDLTKSLDFKDLTTRKHYPGAHFINLKLNGNKLNRLEFELKEK
ncbi:MAG: DNA alkylation repair protein [Flavobacteriales bacterium]|nr:DNA alkylation repair protein [Flavobacteriales bacterium]